MRGKLSAVLGVKPEQVRVVAEEVGGGFGVRFNAYPEYGALLYAAKKLGRPVKWIGSRSEVFLGDEQARDIVHEGEMALSAEGRILGLRFSYVANLGAYLAFTGAVVNTRAASGPAVMVSTWLALVSPVAAAVTVNEPASVLLK